MAYLYDLTDTWNAAGTVFNAIKMNVTNTASAAGSKIVALQVGATDRFTVDKDGNGYFSGTLQAVGSITAPNIYIGTNSGTIGMQDNSASILAYNGTGSGGITNTLRFNTAATERMRIDSSGRVGIGTATPAARLHLYDAAAPEARLQIGTNTSQGLFSFYTGSSKEGGVGFYPVSAMMDISSGRSAGWGGTITLTTDTSERMRITSAGNVGIGTSSPSATLHATVGNAGAGTLAQLLLGYLGGSTNYYTGNTQIFRTGNTTETMRIDSSGNVGIGTSSPSVALQVQRSSANATIRIASSGGAGRDWDIKSQTDGYLTIGSDLLASQLNLYAGNLGLGGTPSAWLSAYRALDIGTDTSLVSQGGSTAYYFNSYRDSNGNFIYKTSAAASRYQQGDGAHYWHIAPSGTAGNAISFTQAMTLDASGNLAVGSGLAATARLIVASTTSTGEMRIQGSGTNSFYGGLYKDNGTGEFRITQADGGVGMTFYTGSSPSERMRIDSSGNVGIGTSSPGTRLHIAAANTAGSDNTGNVYITTTDAQAADVGGKLTLGGFYNGSSTYAFGGIAGRKENSTSNNVAGYLQFLTTTSAGALTERMRIDSSGNLLVGTATPAYSTSGRGLVEVNGSSSAIIAIKTGDTARGYFGASTTLTELSAVGASQPLAFTTNGAERARIDSSGNVGIGTSSPGLPLDVQSNASGLGIRIRGRAADSNGYLQFSSNNLASSSYIGSDGASLRFDTGGTERARIDSSGNLLVGTTALAPDSGFSFLSSGYTAECRMRVGHTTGTASGSAYAEFLYAAGTIGSITQNGTTAVAYNTSSDYRLKDIDGPIQNSGAYIDALKPVQGSWKADGSRFIGLIAHEVQEVSETQIATGVKDGDEMQAMDYSAPELIANLIAEIQSLRARVAQLEGN